MFLNLEWRKLKGLRDLMRALNVCLDTKRVGTTRFVTPQTRGSVDYLSTCGIQVDVRLPGATSEYRTDSPLYGELYPNTSPA